MKTFTPEQWARILAPENHPRVTLPEPNPDDYEVYTLDELREELKKQQEEKRNNSK